MKKMRRHRLTLLVAAWVAAVAVAACGRKVTVTELNIVPEPVFQMQKEGSYTLIRNVKIATSGLGQNSPTAKYILNSLRHARLHPSLVPLSEDYDLMLMVNDTVNPELGDEGYLLEVRENGVSLSANTETGLFYAYQTFVQMLPPDVVKKTYRSVTLPQCTILDYPRFEWRGAHLDVCRHFFPVKFIKKYIDVMAAYKLNRFHWHLSNDHGWRLPSERYPLLNRVGSWRVDRDNQPWGKADPPGEGERATYGGYYTAEEIAEVVEYAAARGITVVPEVEIPGHCSAILASYPSLGCTGESVAIPIGPYWPATAILCAGNDSTLAFINDILDEVAALFPSPYIHIGGDEALYNHWRECPKCRQRKTSNHLADEQQLQGWLMRQAADHLRSLGKIPMGWDDIVDCGGMGSGGVVTAYRNQKEAEKAARAGYKVVQCPSELCYLDHYQADVRYQPAAVGGMTTLAQAYSYDPAPKGMNSHVAKNILGGQCNLWTEYVNTPAHAEYMLLPRMLAISEALWSQPERREWSRFRKKVEAQKDRLTAKGYNYCEGSFTPIFHVTRINDNTMNVSIETEVPNTYIFYTTDLSTPTRNSSIYLGPINLERGTHIKTLTVYNNVERDSVYEFIIN